MPGWPSPRRPNSAPCRSWLHGDPCCLPILPKQQRSLSPNIRGPGPSIRGPGPSSGSPTRLPWSCCLKALLQAIRLGHAGHWPRYQFPSPALSESSSHDATSPAQGKADSRPQPGRGLPSLCLVPPLRARSSPVRAAAIQPGRRPVPLAGLRRVLSPHSPNPLRCSERLLFRC